MRREAERLVDARLELLREDVLELVRLRMDVLDVEPERLRQVELEEPVVADDLDRDPLARGGQREAPVRLELQQLEGRELLRHRAGRGCGDTLPAGERRDRHPSARLLELVDLLQVVLDRL